MRRQHAEERDAPGTSGRATEVAPPPLPAPRGAMSQADVLALQRTAGNSAVARALAAAPPAPRRPAGRPVTPGGPKVAREESLVQQGLLAIAGGGVTLSISAYQKKDVAWRNAAKGVGELDRNGAPLGNHLGPTDALRHCSWSALVMLAALKEDSPQTGLLDAVSGIGAPRIPSPSSLLSTSPASGVHLFPTARERTRAVLLSHEIAGSGTGTSDSKMDQANNETGMALAETLWQQGKRDDASICQAAIGALESGALKMFDIDGNLISTAGWRELSTDTWINNLFLDVVANPIPRKPRPRTRAEQKDIGGA